MIRGQQFEKYRFEKNAFTGANTITTNKILTHLQSAIFHIFYSIFGYNLCKKKLDFLNQLHGMTPLRLQLLFNHIRIYQIH